MIGVRLLFHPKETKEGSHESLQCIKALGNGLTIEVYTAALAPTVMIEAQIGNSGTTA